MFNAIIRGLPVATAVCAAMVLLRDNSCDQRAEGAMPGECNDYADNDADGLFDCMDPSCYGAPVCVETPPEPPPAVDPTGPPTYVRDVQPLLMEHCADGDLWEPIAAAQRKKATMDMARCTVWLGFEWPTRRSCRRGRRRTCT